jgi:5-methylcytosine-specific restriction endonuclease McrA
MSSVPLITAEGKRSWEKRNPERAKEIQRRYDAKYPGKRTEAARRAVLMRDFGITLEEYEAMDAAQNGVCAICRRKCKSGRRLAVDHCHKTSKVRGLLCMNCNNAIGRMGDDPLLLRAAASYLERTQ